MSRSRHAEQTRYKKLHVKPYARHKQHLRSIVRIVDVGAEASNLSD